MVTLNALNQITKVNVLSTPSLTVLDNRRRNCRWATRSRSPPSPPRRSTPPALFQRRAISLDRRHSFDHAAYQRERQPDAGAGAGSLQRRPEHAGRRAEPEHSAAPDQDPGHCRGRRVGDAGRPDPEPALLDTTQVPVVGDVPVLGTLFKQKADAITKSELLIMITPHIVHTSNDAREITAEYRRKLFQITRTQKPDPTQSSKAPEESSSISEGGVAQSQHRGSAPAFPGETERKRSLYRIEPCRSSRIAKGSASGVAPASPCRY